MPTSIRVTIDGAGEGGGFETASGGSASPVTVTVPEGAAAAPPTGGVSTSSGTQPRSTRIAEPSASTSGVSTWFPG